MHSCRGLCTSPGTCTKLICQRSYNIERRVGLSTAKASTYVRYLCILFGYLCAIGLWVERTCVVPRAAYLLYTELMYGCGAL